MRIEYEEVSYRVLSRGNERKDIFRDEKDLDLFLEILGEMSARFSIDIFAYVLMGKHQYKVELKERTINKQNI
ncbi:MAG: hypothetical protein D8M57_18945 [Candidatus Scalindua sp. AMX11]|nr:MAG: hypothetical protein DWQ00_08870 [Candidatus Scalindua sp.]TDE63317.1 MAG: hypothetical protein D8M57_18945 [Candidatus Scalindua sp. AMX11]GJQ57528.1 MAG: hypothetical protein SCALA701_03290 [Candidatus Scalindua sp.]